MSRRYKSVTMKFGLPLALPTSRVVFRCYASHGIAYARTPPASSDLILLLVDAQRDARWARGHFVEHHRFLCDDAQDGAWERLGWIMADGSQPLGELEAVDPELAQFEYLPPADNRNARLEGMFDDWGVGPHSM
jgi:hypothetical protein